VRLAGLVGDDAFGADLRSAVATHGVDVTHVAVLERSSTGMAFIAVEEGGENMITIAAGANGALTPEALGGATGLRALLSDAEALLLQLEIPLATCVAAAETARELGVPVVLNAAPCPPEVTSELVRLLRLTDALIVNETEAATLAGSADPTALLSLGPSVVVVTLGRHGATADDGTGRIDVPASWSPVWTRSARATPSAASSCWPTRPRHRWPRPSGAPARRVHSPRPRPGRSPPAPRQPGSKS